MAASTRWGLSAGLSASLGEIGGAQGLFLTLLDVTAQLIYPIKYTGLGLVAGLKAGLSVSTESFTFFTTVKPLTIYDFSTRAWLATVEFTPGVGGSQTYITFGRINHSPYWIDIGGLTVGVAAGAGVFTGKIDVYPENYDPVVGPPITP